MTLVGAKRKEIPRGTPDSPSVGRYVLYAPIGHGGMATVHLARLLGAAGVTRKVAAKRLHPQFVEDQDIVTMFLDEARIASKIHHPNVVPVLDVVADGNELILVQEYVHGVPLDKLFKAAQARGSPIPVPIAVAIVAGVLSGLHAAHQTKDDNGEALAIVHRDVTPQNVIVSVEGVPRLLDFGIAKARFSPQVTREGLMKGKLAYMAPEQVTSEPVTAKTDVFGTGVLLWELLAHTRFDAGCTDLQLVSRVLTGRLPKLAAALIAFGPERRQEVARLDPIVARALASDPGDRFESAASMLEALVSKCAPASPAETSQWVRTLGADYLAARDRVLAAMEESPESLSKFTAAASVPASGSMRTGYRRTMTATTPGSPIAPRLNLSRTITPPNVSQPWKGRLVWTIAATLTGLLAVWGGPNMAGRVRAQNPNGRMETGAAPVAAASRAIPPEVGATSGVGVGAAAGSTGAIGASEIAGAARSPGSLAPAHPAPSSSPSPPRPSNPAVVPAAPPRRAAAAKVAQASAAGEGAPAAAGKATPDAPPSTADCDPPYYFEGSKKHFKLNCL